MNRKPISYEFNPEKTAQAANRLLRFSGGHRNYLELIKLLYLADRQALIKLQSPITGDRLASLPYGPVLSHVLDMIRWGPTYVEDAPWFEAVSGPSNYKVRAIGDPGESHLSGAECQILDEVFQKYGAMDWKQLSEMTHNLPEWSNPEGSSKPITPEQILGIAGYSQEEIESIANSLSMLKALDQDVQRYAGQVF